MLWPKKADRAGLHAGGAAWALGLVRGRGRPLPSRAASRCVVAAARPTGNPAARVHPGRHNQDPDPVPSRIRPGAAAASPPLHQCGAAPVAERAPERDPGGAAGSNGLTGCSRHASGLGGVAGGPDAALPLAARPEPAEHLWPVLDEPLANRASTKAHPASSLSHYGLMVASTGHLTDRRFKLL